MKGDLKLFHKAECKMLYKVMEILDNNLLCKIGFLIDVSNDIQTSQNIGY